ncbi:NusG domain II-containing protein [Peptostreptococcus anaerobius]|uniref:NusG domain II-containing protein n=1 Tax=Peptostreptococcus porci TaxID=2652282 RepID=A0A6N7XI82_9FIRM|nr:NusG domain II-containing protein [Peptostreptococcus porci]MDD7183454.1 NusG domain II-containing protein [Peptostreptococcus porci]MDY5963759.1 NusG domain II-containing protein [Peptostreptococcus porci]MDY6231387.1 NusG domain II-containing protein [Peptostreptococcus porci]MST63114.1 NusG domain II-containing protein [Peptostreptococcus porci]
MKKKDIIVIFVVAIAIISSILVNRSLNSSPASTVQIYVGDKLYKELPINKDTTITLDNSGKNIIKVHNNGVEMIEANCPDQVCIKTGFISKPGQSIVCLPHKVNVKIVGESSESDNDIEVK